VLFYPHQQERQPKRALASRSDGNLSEFDSRSSMFYVCSIGADCQANEPAATTVSARLDVYRRA
jgi:hypothetical protein